jgi:hypothetical protein
MTSQSERNAENREKDRVLSMCGEMVGQLKHRDEACRICGYDRSRTIKTCNFCGATPRTV